MHTHQFPEILTEDEFDSIMREFDVAADWMRCELAKRRLRPHTPEGKGDAADDSSVIKTRA